MSTEYDTSLEKNLPKASRESALLGARLANRYNVINKAADSVRYLASPRENIPAVLAAIVEKPADIIETPSLVPEEMSIRNRLDTEHTEIITSSRNAMEADALRKIEEIHAAA